MQKNNQDILENKKIFLKNFFIVILLVLLVNIGIVFFSDFNSIYNELKNINYTIIFSSFFIFSLIYIVDTIRLKIILFSLDKKILWREAFYNSISGYFVSNLTPMASGGQPYQIYHLTQNNIDSKTATNIIISRLVEFLIFSTFMVLIFFKKILNIVSGDFIGSKFLSIGLILSGFITIFIIFIFINPKYIYILIEFFHKIFKFKKSDMFLNNILNWTIELKESIVFLWSEKKIIILIDFLLGALLTLIQSYALYNILIGLTTISYSFFDVMLIFILLNFVIYYVPTPGSSGGIEGIYSMVLSGIIVKGYPVMVPILVWRISTYFLQIVFQLIILFILRRHKVNA